MSIHTSISLDFIMKLSKSFCVTAFITLVNFSYVAQTFKVKFTNLQCISLDKKFVTFTKCYLKARARDAVSLHVHGVLHKLPIDNVTANAALFRKGSGYRPFLYNDTTDFCQFLRQPSRYMFWKIAYELAKPSTNINHTCPIDHDVIVEGLILNAEMFNLIPFPPNDYMVQLQFAAYNDYKAKVKVYIKSYD